MNARPDVSAGSTDAPVIPPLVKVLELRCGADRAWHVLTERVGDWWPMATHSVDGDAARGVRLDAAGFVETLGDGTQTSWGEVLAWDPPQRLLVTWHPGSDPARATEVEITLTPIDPTTTALRLVHRGWDRLEPGVADRLAEYDKGWGYVLGCLADAVGSGIEA